MKTVNRTLKTFIEVFAEKARAEKSGFFKIYNDEAKVSPKESDIKFMRVPYQESAAVYMQPSLIFSKVQKTFMNDISKDTNTSDEIMTSTVNVPVYFAAVVKKDGSIYLTDTMMCTIMQDKSELVLPDGVYSMEDWIDTERKRAKEEIFPEYFKTLPGCDESELTAQDRFDCWKNARRILFETAGTSKRAEDILEEKLQFYIEDYIPFHCIITEKNLLLNQSTNDAVINYCEKDESSFSRRNMLPKIKIMYLMAKDMIHSKSVATPWELKLAETLNQQNDLIQNKTKGCLIIKVQNETTNNTPVMGKILSLRLLQEMAGNNNSLLYCENLFPEAGGGRHVFFATEDICSVSCMDTVLCVNDMKSEESGENQNTK